MIRRRLLCLLLLLLGFTSSPAWAERPLIVTSTHPLALIVKEVAGEQADVRALVPADVSPHHYSMRPSERRSLAEADRIYWLGAGLEPYLQGTMSDSTLVGKTRTLVGAPQNPPENDDHGHHHATGEDPHVWLSPERALAMARRARGTLGALDGVDDQAIERNYQGFEQRLVETTERIRAQLEPLQVITLFTYHDAFHYFADHFGLTIAGTLTNNPERSPSARHIAGLQQSLEAARFPCIMTETQLGGDWWRGLDVPQPLAVSRWDPVGGDIPISVGGYTAFLESLADAVSRCRPEQQPEEK
ncbi:MULTISPECIES: metal ABC transporter substrate-binding protein [Halomonadaceae]|uniref:High-affinity zinc uptake system protein ZnuA n=1 Tax=Vreelandella halophila TaxID=86177 RepID=A0A9X5B677_9GAMM|nr:MULTISPECIES: metal ABC transporter substrate-binding protein [Halomonas]MYL26952.1 ABC transporter substrate-binding protein [Halomonas utahensis]MYL74213.1 ABC transporter substrate-binding protein [Halomonas sp. 22501_18_FS]